MLTVVNTVTSGKPGVHALLHVVLVHDHDRNHVNAKDLTNVAGVRVSNQVVLKTATHNHARAGAIGNHGQIVPIAVEPPLKIERVTVRAVMQVTVQMVTDLDVRRKAGNRPSAKATRANGIAGANGPSAAPFVTMGSELLVAFVTVPTALTKPNAVAMGKTPRKNHATMAPARTVSIVLNVNNSYNTRI